MDALANPYLTRCLHCGRPLCAVCEFLSVQLRRARAGQDAALHARRAQHRAKYH